MCKLNCKYISCGSVPFDFYCNKIKDYIICISFADDCKSCTPENNDWFACCLYCKKYIRANNLFSHRIKLFFKYQYCKIKEQTFV